MQAEHYNGLIAVWKERGYTSHDVVAKLRGILHQKRIGHTGTLDPQAEGVLAVGVGLGTKTFDLLPDHWKTYEAEVTFGIQTDTEDIWGTILQTQDVSYTPEQITQAICAFEGTYNQVPPMYSAKKIDGKKLYQLAREGKTVERKAVPVTLKDIQVLSVTGNKARFLVTCSAGTYIRTLCVDIGKMLGCEACMSSLTRVMAGGFSKEQALTLDEIKALVDKNELESRLISIDAALSHFPKVLASNEFEKQLKNGNAIGVDAVSGLPEAATDTCDQEFRVRLYLNENGGDGEFIGVYRLDTEDKLLKPVKIFYRN